jgi:hypothetical protein
MATKSPLRRPASAIEVCRPFIFGGGLLALLLGIAGWRISEYSRLSKLHLRNQNKPLQAAPLCPWRDPESDQKLFLQTRRTAN